VPYIYLLLLGFVVGLSGAMIPGPLLVYTISESLSRGWKTGFFVIVGHALVEVIVMLLLLAGVSALMTTPLFVKALGLIGGAAMMYTAYGLYVSGWEFKRGAASAGYGAITGGIIFTAFNPSFPMWWATAGARLILEGLYQAGILGAFLVLAGHWGADLGWYMLISSVSSKGCEKAIASRMGYVKRLLALTLAGLGAYFIWGGLTATLI